MRKYSYFSQWDALAVQSKTKHQSNTFENYAIKFVTEILIKNDYLLPQKFEIYKSFVKALLGHKIQEDSDLRVSLYEKFIYTDVEVDIIHKLSEFEQITFEVKEVLVDFAIQALENRTVTSENYIKSIDCLIQMLSLKRIKFAERLDKLDTLRINSTENKYNPVVTIKNPLDMLIGKKLNFDFKTSRSLENEKSKELITKLSILNDIIHNDEVQSSLAELESQIEIVDHRIILVGEIKHGKSSIFNRLVGDEVSPVGEGTSTTSAAIELYYSKRPKYEIKWMSIMNLKKILSYINENKNNDHIWEYKFMLEELLEKNYFKPGSTVSDIKSREDLYSYIAVGEKYSPGVEIVKIGYPVECLKHGAIIVDTPGLNDPMKVRDEITKQEAYNAGTIIFVMRADKFGTDSERLMLNEIVQSGRALELIIILTHIDRISGDKERQRIYNGAREWLKKVSNNNVFNDVPIYAFDARFSTTTKEEKEMIKDFGYNAFIHKLSNPLSDHKKNRQYVESIRKKRKSIFELAKYEYEKFLQKHMESSCSPELIKNLNMIIDGLEDMNRIFIEEINHIVDNVKNRHKNDYEKLVFEIEQCKRLIIQNIKASLEDKIRELGNKYDNKPSWNTFYSEIATQITLHNTDMLEDKVQSILNHWGWLIPTFDENLSTLLESKKGILFDIKTQFESFANDQNLSFYMLCESPELFDDINTRIKSVQALGKAYAKSKGITTEAINASVSKAINTSFPPAIPWKPFTFNFGGIVKNLFKDKDGQKENFIQMRISEINDTVIEHFDTFSDEIDIIFADFEWVIKIVIEKNYRPIINAIQATTMDLKNQILIAERIHGDLRSFASKLNEEEKEIIQIN